MAEWTTPQYSRGAVKRASKALIQPKDAMQHLEALRIVDNWRASHSYPLQTVLMLLRGNAHAVDPKADVVRRLKRLRSIRAKLERTNLDLTQMQDLGGCRAIVHTLDHVGAVVDRLDQSRTLHELYDRDDYISQPKETGYRSYHLMFKAMSKGRPEFDGLRIEVQIRTQCQHWWATAVETVGLFSTQDLKGSQGDDRWLRFFALMGSEVAHIEGTPGIPNTPATRGALRAELRNLARELEVLRKLEAYGAAIQYVTGANSRAATYLLIVNAQDETVSIQGYTPGARTIAQEDYEHAETEYVDKPAVDAVLVAADSVDSLKRAYPNYFADTAAFREIVAAAIA